MSDPTPSACQPQDASERHPLLHDWLYAIVARVCYDRDYLYLSFVRHFGALLVDIQQGGALSPAGQYAFTGLKSGLQVELEWRLERRLDWTSPNRLTIDCRIVDVAGDLVERHEASFEPATGESVL